MCGLVSKKAAYLLYVVVDGTRYETPTTKRRCRTRLPLAFHLPASLTSSSVTVDSGGRPYLSCLVCTIEWHEPSASAGLLRKHTTAESRSSNVSEPPWLMYWW